jgi:tetratricopeptide (TPR) repeat protein
MNSHPRSADSIAAIPLTSPSDASPDDLVRTGEDLLAQRRPREAAQAFAQALSVDPRHPTALVLLGDARSAGGDLPGALGAYQTALLSRPLDVTLRRKVARLLLSLRYAAAAEGLYRDLLRVAPDDPGLLADLALSLCEQRRFEEVPALCRQALALDPNTVGAYVASSLALTAADQPEQAEAMCRRAIALAPESLEARINLAVCHLETNQRRSAIEVCADTLAIEPNCQEARWNLGLAQLALGQFAEGWENYEARKHRGYGGADRTLAAPLWDGVASLRGRTILVHAEQGLGDTIQFCRYAPFLAAAGATVLLEVQSPLGALCRTLKGAAGVYARGEPLPPHDLQVPLLSLPRAFRTRTETIPANVPYLTADAQKVTHWRQELGPGPNIGLVWSGNPIHGRDVRRSIPLPTFAAVMAGVPARFWSLQKEIRPADAAALSTLPQLVDLSAQLADFGDTAAAIAALDLVITVDTATAHLAGALGRPVWVLLPFAADWRWMMDRTDTPWYPTMRLFRQSAACRWDPVLEAVRGALVERLRNPPGPA